MKEAGRNIKKYEDWKTEMIRIAEKAKNDNRLINAAIYFRSAEFFTLCPMMLIKKFYMKNLSTFSTNRLKMII